MNKLLVVGLKVALVAVMTLYPNLGAIGTAKAAPIAGATPSVFAKTGTLKGVLVDQASGKSIKGRTLTILDTDGEKVASAVTDKAGKFKFPNLKPGQYRLMIGDVELKLTVADDGNTTDLKIVMPKAGGKLAPGMVKASGASNWTYIALAGLTAAILVPSGFAIAAAVNDDDDGHD